MHILPSLEEVRKVAAGKLRNPGGHLHAHRGDQDFEECIEPLLYAGIGGGA